MIEELNKIATDPDENHVFNVFDFSALGGIIETLKNACECKSTNYLRLTRFTVTRNFGGR